MEDTPEVKKTLKRKRKAEKTQEVKEPKKVQKVEKKVKVEPKVSFSAWFHKKVAERKVRFYEDESILVFFKKRGLTEMETEDTYESVFKLY